MIRIKKGLRLPINGHPRMEITSTPKIKSVALLGPDYWGMKPQLKVQVGEKVQKGQVLFEDKKCAGILYTAPCSGTVAAINRGAKRAFLSLVIERDGADQTNAVSFESYNSSQLAKLGADKIKEQLLKSGLWTALRERPFGHVARPHHEPKALFVKAIDTNPLSADPRKVIELDPERFKDGLKLLSQLTKGTLHLCQDGGENLPLPHDPEISNIKVTKFTGIHPAGNVGTHINALHPVTSQHTHLWYVDYQDVIAMGQLFTTGKLSSEKIISLAGPKVKNPSLIKVPHGANLDEITEGLVHRECEKGTCNRVISGSPLAGRQGSEALNFLGRYHRQVSVLEEGDFAEFIGWKRPGLDKFSVMRTFVSKLIPNKNFAFNTNLNGSLRAIVPVGAYEKVTPLKLLITPLLKALLSYDTDMAQKLGVLDLEEEDLALCTFACPSKIDYGQLLRENLEKIEKDG